jgi:hypothetical protein
MKPTIGLTPPEPEACLVKSRVSRFKGGTLIDADVRDLAIHERRIRDPDGYRPEACPRCGHARLHIHGYPRRRPIGETGAPVVIRIVQYICASGECRATWRLLPMILARHLWRQWRTVERAVKPKDTPARADAPKIPARTVRRWRARLASSAAVIVALIAGRGGRDLAAHAAVVGHDISRMVLVDAFTGWTNTAPGSRLSVLATLTHALERGVRLM